MGLGFDTFFPARSHSPREAGRRFIKLASTFLKRGTLPIPLRTNRTCRYAYCLWRFFRKIGRRRRLLHLRHNESLRMCPNPLKLACIGRHRPRVAMPASDKSGHSRARLKCPLSAPEADNRAHLCDHFTSVRASPAASKITALFEPALTRRHRCSKTCGSSYHRDRLIHHCMPIALWYGRKRANIGYGQRGL